MEETVITVTASETAKLGERLAKKLYAFRLSERQNRGSTSVGALVLALYGELGSGKTTFVQGLAKGYGISKRIISPTFVLMRQYKINSKSQIPNSNFFYHIDLYRIESQEDLKGLGIEEILNDSQNIVAIEWAERLGEMLPKKRVDITFAHVDEAKREITMKIND